MRIVGRCLVVFSLLAAVAEAQRPNDRRTEDEVLAVWRKGVAAFIAADDPDEALRIYMSLHTADAILMFPARPALVGTGEIVPYIREFCRAYRFDLPDLRTEELTVRADVAIHRYSGTAVLIPRAGGEPRRVARKYVDVLRRGDDGRWKVSLHIFNTNQ
jgi:ketosteroid isomerase-like protein